MGKYRASKEEKEVDSYTEREMGITQSGGQTNAIWDLTRGRSHYVLRQ